MSGLAEEEIEQSTLGRALRFGGGLVLLAAVVAGLVFIVQGLGGEAKAPARQVTKITVLDVPPPPPPPPPKEEPKREPPKEAPREVKLDQPKPVEQPPQDQAEQLKMEGEAGDGPSPFASGTVSRDYIGGELGSGVGGGTLQYAFFTNALQRHIQGELARNRKIKNNDYRIAVEVWIGNKGVIQRVEFVDSIGSPEADQALRAALLEMTPLRTAVPPGLPQPLKLRITNRLTG